MNSSMRSFVLTFAVVFTAISFCCQQARSDSFAIAETQEDASSLTSEEIRESANRVMQQHDYRSVRRRVLEDDEMQDMDTSFLWQALAWMGRSVGSFFEWLFSGLANSNTPNSPAAPATASTSDAPPSGMDFSLGTVTLYVGLSIVIVAAIWIIASVVRQGDGQRRPNSAGLFGDEENPANLSTPPGEQAASTYETRAIRLADQGNYRAAIRELLIGSMSWIERAGLIRFRKGLTNRDYVRAVWREADRRSAYLTTAVEFERVYFGRRPATREMFDVCLSSFQGAFREEEAPAAV